MGSTPRPLSALDPKGLRGVLTDIDDTITTDGQLLPEAYDALWTLKRAGFAIVPVTGRSAGWAHMILKTWPVDAVVAESGGLWIGRDRDGNALRMHLHDEPALIARTRARLADCAQRVMAAIPGLAPASDNAYRCVDLALDYCEEVPRGAESDVRAAIDRFRAEGFHARASSVHINAWHGEFDKAPTALRCIAQRWSGTALADPGCWAFIGDAPNDASMFAAFPVSVGVANITPVLDQLPVSPAFVTEHRSGEGFAAFARHLARMQTR